MCDTYRVVMGSWRPGRAGVFLLLLVVGGCEDELDTDRAAALIAPHREDFVEFDRWARRTLGAGPVLRERGVVEGTLFAPVRHDSEVVAAWVRREGTPAFRLRGSQGWPEEVSWLQLRDERLGPLRVGATSLRDLRGGRRVDVVLVSRTATVGEGVEVRVVVAYARGPQGESRPEI